MVVAVMSSITIIQSKAPFRFYDIELLGITSRLSIVYGLQVRKRQILELTGVENMRQNNRQYGSDHGYRADW
jgi:hypothetical protein